MFSFKDTLNNIFFQAQEEKRLTNDKNLIFKISQIDPLTCRERKVKDVFTDKGSLAFLSKVVSRSAKATEIVYREPDKIIQEILLTLENHLNLNKLELFYLDKRLGLDPAHSYHCRTILPKDYARLLVMWDKLIFDIPKIWEDKEPDQILISIPEWETWAEAKNLPPCKIIVGVKDKITFVLGSDYFGEIKKGHLRMAMYAEKLKYKNAPNSGGLGVHAGGKLIKVLSEGEIKEKGALFFGLSGTGKTSLSVHHHWLNSDLGEGVIIRQDDFFVLTLNGKAYGTEDNAYIKTEALEENSQPLLYQGATSSSAILENVYVDPQTKRIDFFNYSHPLRGKCLNGRGIIIRRELPYTDERIDLEKVDLIFFISRRDTIVPPVVKLNQAQGAAFFMLGESIITSAADPLKIGESIREVGTNPFIVGDEAEEGNIFFKILKNNPQIKIFLLNTGSFGEKEKITIEDSCIIIREIARDNIIWEEDFFWNYLIPKEIPGIDLKRFNPFKYYTKEKYEILANKLKLERQTWLKKFINLNPEILKAI